jgi:hypothetical protein
MHGVPLGMYDFGHPIGVQQVGPIPDPLGKGADTIVRRQAPSHGPEETIPIEMQAMQLTSSVPVDLFPLGGFGMDFISITLQTARTPAEVARYGPGQVSDGTMAIRFPKRPDLGDLDWDNDVDFDDVEPFVLCRGPKRFATL